MAVYDDSNTPTMTAEQIVSLKSAVKQEMLRRKYTGSVSSYGNSSYDFNETPSQGGAILTEHGEKIIAPLLAIKDVNGLTPAKLGKPIPEGFDYNSLNTIVTNLKKEPKYGDSSTCKSSCTGLCKTTCSGTCSGCTGCSSCSSCSGTCSGCSGGCSGGCSSCSGCSGCGSACETGCSGMCVGACSLSCTGANSY